MGSKARTEIAVPRGHTLTWIDSHPVEGPWDNTRPYRDACFKMEAPEAAGGHEAHLHRVIGIYLGLTGGRLAD